jgi:glycosyltransferase involved in cell wall biosynthesis
MSIVHIVDRVKQGHGRGLSALAIAQAQYRAGWNVRLLVSGVHNPELLRPEPRYEALFGDLTVDVYRNVEAIADVATALEVSTGPGDVIVGHEGVDLAAACRLPYRRVIAAVHSDPDACLGYLPAPDLRVLARRVDHWVAWGTAVATRLSQRLDLDPERIAVSGQSVEPGDHRTRVLAGSPACLSVARIHPVKNHALMLEASAVLAERWPGTHWHMAGGCDDGVYLETLQSLAGHLGVSDRITWHGYRDDAAAMMLGSDVVVLSSHSEGVPRAIQEAMALGVPTVMPAALAYDLVHGELPVTYASNRPGALARAVELAIKVAPDRRAAASRWVLRTWSRPRVLRDWERALGPAAQADIASPALP